MKFLEERLMRDSCFHIGTIRAYTFYRIFFKIVAELFVNGYGTVKTAPYFKYGTVLVFAFFSGNGEF
jgi:hypothetical protein